MATMPPSAVPMERIDLSDTFGSAYIGAMIMMILYGITTLQTYLYFVRYPRDPLTVKYLVSSLWMFDTLHICLVSHAMYFYLVSNYSNPAELDVGVWSLFLSVGVNVLIAFVTQCFFTQRLHRLSDGKWWLTIIIFLSVLAHFALGMETMAELYLKRRLSRLSEITFNAALPFAIVAVLSDILITLALCVLLHNSRTGFRSTNTLVNYLMIYAINRCLLTSIVAVAEVITFSAMPHSLWFLAIDFVIGKLYANSLLATLNTRSALAGKGLDTEASTDDDTPRTGATSLQINSVTPSMMFSHSEFSTTGRERVSLRLNAGSRTTASTELKDSTQKPLHAELSDISKRDDSTGHIDIHEL